jgi:hypothetical protein
VASSTFTAISAEFEFRYNHREKLEISDTMRAEIALKGFLGKRLTYETSCERRLRGSAESPYSGVPVHE